MGFVGTVLFYTLSVATIVSWYRAMLLEPGRVPRGWVRMAIGFFFDSFNSCCLTCVGWGQSVLLRWWERQRKKLWKRWKSISKRRSSRRHRFGNHRSFFVLLPLAHSPLAALHFRKSAPWWNLSFVGASFAMLSNRYGWIERRVAHVVLLLTRPICCCCAGSHPSLSRL